MRSLTILRRGAARLGLVVVLSLALAGAALAGGVAVILDAMPENVQAGQPFVVGFTVRSAHADRTPQSGLRPDVLLSHADTGEQVTAQAKPEGEPGHYNASVTLPSAGTWHWRILPFGVGEPAAVTTLSPLVVGGATEAERPAAGETVDVKALSSTFEPAALRVEAGTTVVWHIGDLAHTVTADDGSFASGGLEPGASYSRTFTEPGRFTYVCEYHPGMQGVVEVSAAPVKATQAGPQDTKLLSVGQSAPENQSAAQSLPATGVVERSALALLLLLALGLVIWRRIALR